MKRLHTLMAVALVALLLVTSKPYLVVLRAAQAFVTSATNGDSTANVSVTLNTGDTAVVCVRDGLTADTVTSMTDGIGGQGTYARVGSRQDYGHGAAELWLLNNAVAGTAAITTSPTQGRMRVMTFSGMATSAFDVAAGANGASVLGWTAGTTATTAQANEVVVGCFAGRDYFSPNGPAVGTNFTQPATAWPANDTNRLYFEYRLVSSAAAYTAAINSNTGAIENMEWAGITATFKEAGGGGGTVLRRMLTMGVGDR